MEKNISPVKNRIMLSEQTLITKPDELQQLMSSVMKQGLEGLVLKDLKVCKRRVTDFKVEGIPKCMTQSSDIYRECMVQVKGTGLK